MALHGTPPTFSSSEECRAHANQLLIDSSNHLLAKHLLAWCDVLEGRIPETTIRELRHPSAERARLPYTVNLGWILSRCGRSHEGLNCLSEDMEFEPESDELKLLTGICLQRTRNYETARAVLEEIPANSPIRKEADHYLARALLNTRHWREGLTLLERSRLTMPSREAPFWSDISRLWTGQSLEGKRLVIVGNDHVGDQILLSRLIPMVKQAHRPHTIGLVCSSTGLIELMRTVRDLNRVDSAIFEPYDYFIPLESLMQRLAPTPGTIPEGASLPPCRESHLNARRAKLGYGKPLLGLCWRASNETDPETSPYDFPASTWKSLDLASLERILEELGSIYRFVSVQENPTDAERALMQKHDVLIPENGRFQDYLGLAEWISCMDLVLTVDSPVAHLAGTFGANTHLLFSYSTDWKWSANWYPGVTSHRQISEGSWHCILPGLIETLKNQDFPTSKSDLLAG